MDRGQREREREEEEVVLYGGYSAHNCPTLFILVEDKPASKIM